MRRGGADAAAVVTAALQIRVDDARKKPLRPIFMRTIACGVHFLDIAPDHLPSIRTWDSVLGDFLSRKIRHVLDVMKKSHLIVIAAEQ